MAEAASASAALAGASEMSSGGGGGGHAVRFENGDCAPNEVANGDCAPKEPDESCLARSEERRPWKERSRLSA